MTSPRSDDPPADIALCDFAVNLRFEDLSPEVVAQAKLSILDTLGVAFVGARFGEGAETMLSYARLFQSRGVSTVWSTGERCEPALAALVNAVHTRGLDYDDIIPFPQIHVSVHVVPAVLAVAEYVPEPISGRDLIVAVTIGCEIQSRLARAIAPFFGAGLPTLLSSQIFGYFSAALACGRLLRLDGSKMRNALGLALMHAAGTEEMVVHAAQSMGKSLYAGFSNQGGLQSALMAACGVTAEGRPLTGSAGLFQAYYGGRYDRAGLADRLGSEFASLNRCFKTAPGTLVGHSFAEAASNLVREHGLRPDDISEVILHVGSWGQAMCEPLDIRQHPPSASAAMNSIPFVVAKTIANGRVRLEDFQTPGRLQPEALQVAARTSYRLSPDLSKPGSLEEGIVEIVTADQRRLRNVVRLPMGHPERPLSAEQGIAKFRRNVALSARGLSPERGEEFAGRVMTAEQELDIRALPALFAQGTNGVAA
ncbi:MmgE/PrpD family protein [Bradyrhizobium sp. dw_78]|uniref:MmgE/PrpD family protein n=1 Tax=Bradyrhizobium sp. dw_78 TaxID=2719793 RepID=UPI00320A9D91